MNDSGELLALRIRAALGVLNDDSEPVDLLVRTVCARLAEVEEELAQWQATGESVTRNEHDLAARLAEAEANLADTAYKHDTWQSHALRLHARLAKAEAWMRRAGHLDSCAARFPVRYVNGFPHQNERKCDCGLDAFFAPNSTFGCQHDPIYICPKCHPTLPATPSQPEADNDAR